MKLSTRNKDLDLRRFGKNQYSKALASANTDDMKVIRLTERPVETMDSVEDITAIGLTSAEVEAAAKGQRCGMTYHGQYADFFYMISAASFSTPTVWSISFAHLRYGENQEAASQSVYITVSRADNNVSVLSYEIS